MDISDKDALASAVSTIATTLGVAVDADLLRRYLNRGVPHLLELGFEQESEHQVPALQKYLIGASSYLAQPHRTHNYDIFAAARAVPLIRVLAVALGAVTRIKEVDPILGRLRREKRFDDFESALYELLTAYRYATHRGFDQVEFIQKRSRRSPDFFARSSAGRFTIECKKFARRSLATVSAMRNMEVRAQEVILLLARRCPSCVVELSVPVDPMALDARDVAAAVLDSCRSGATIIAPTFTVRAIPLKEHPSLRSSDVLFPGPQYYSDQYDYVPGDHWHGIVPCVLGKFRGPWLQRVHWECAFKWRVVDPSSLLKRQRLAYKRILEGADQLKSVRGTRILHVAFERDLGLGHRAESLKDFVVQFGKKAFRLLHCIVFNDLSIDVTCGGRFDFVEHAHYLGRIANPPVTSVFTSPEDELARDGEWGIGRTLPPLDDAEH